jgi:signal transduction histidine kinase
MLGALSVLLDKPLIKIKLNEILSGSILLKILLTQSDHFSTSRLLLMVKVMGMITVADVRAGMYKEEEMTILYKITQQASNAVTRLQQVVRTEQVKMNAMVESMQDGMIMTDADYRILVINPAAKRVIGANIKKK